MAFFDASGLMDKAYNQLLTVYPDELEIAVGQGRYTINQDLPYAIPLPAAWQDADGPVNGIIFTSDTLVRSIADVVAQDSYLVLTETTAYSVQPNGEVSARDILVMLEEYDDAEEFIFSEELIQQIPMQKIKGLWWLNKWFYIPFAAFFGSMVAFFVLTFWMLIKVTIYGFIAFIAYELLFSNRLSYGRIVQLTIHVLASIALLRWLLTPINLGMGGFVWFLVYILAMLVIGRHLEKVGALAQEETPKKLQNTSVKAVQTTTRSATTVAVPATKKTAKRTSPAKNSAVKTKVKKAITKPAKKSTKKPPTKKVITTKKPTTKKVVTKTVKKPTTKSTTKTVVTKKVPSKKTTTKAVVTKKPAAKKVTSKKVAPKKAAPKKTSVKKPVAKKAATKKIVKKVAPKRAVKKSK